MADLRLDEDGDLVVERRTAVTDDLVLSEVHLESAPGSSAVTTFTCSGELAYGGSLSLKPRGQEVRPALRDCYSLQVPYGCPSCAQRLTVLLDQGHHINCLLLCRPGADRAPRLGYSTRLGRVAGAPTG